MELKQDTYVPNSKAMRYKDRTGEYFFDDNKTNLLGVGEAFYMLRENFFNILNK